MFAEELQDNMLPSSVSFLENQLCYSGQKCQKIPETLIKLYGLKTHCLDLSYNELITTKGLEGFPNLRELILDNNNLSDNLALPKLPELHTLSLNKNQICNLDSLLRQIMKSLPKLTYLSLLGNTACPNQLSSSENDEEDYQRYRYYVLYHLPDLRFLDSNKVRDREKIEAKKRGKFMNIVRPKSGDLPDENVESATTETVGGRTKIFSPLPKSIRGPEDHKGAYGKCRYKYSGKHSEGNRFISNNDL